MAIVKLKSEIRIKSVDSIAAAAEGQGDLFVQGDIVYSIADTDFKKRNASAYDGSSAAASWDTISAGGTTNLAIANRGASTLRITSSTGTNADVPLADTSRAGLMSDVQFDKLAAIEASATADQTNAEIRAAVEAATDSNAFTDADHSKLNAIEASADVTDATNVTAAGALMLSLADAKGDLLVASADNTVVRLPVHASNGKILKTDSSAASGLAWGSSTDSTPMFAAVSLSGNTDVKNPLNSGVGGTLILSDSGQNAAGTTERDGFTVNTAALSRETVEARYEIMSGLANKGFRFKADTTDITSFGGGQATISASTGDRDGVSVSDTQKLVLLHTGSAWKYMIQSI